MNETFGVEENNYLFASVVIWTTIGFNFIKNYRKLKGFSKNQIKKFEGAMSRKFREMIKSELFLQIC